MRYRKSGTATGALSVQDPRIEKFAFFQPEQLFEKEFLYKHETSIITCLFQSRWLQLLFSIKTLSICDIKCLPHK